jgi:hypothetical protein
MDVEETGTRTRRPTVKGAEYAAGLQAKKTAALARIQARQRTARSQPEFDELAAMLSRVTVAESDADVDALASQLGRMGGRKRRTLKKRGKKSRKTRKH